MSGSCYLTAGRFVLDAPESLNARLVHGYPRLAGGPHRGRLYGHAWVEIQAGALVIDTEAGKVIQASLYYAAGQIDEGLVRRFDRETTRRLVLERETWGPWVEVALPEAALFADRAGRIYEEGRA